MHSQRLKAGFVEVLQHRLCGDPSAHCPFIRCQRSGSLDLGSTPNSHCTVIQARLAELGQVPALDNIID